MSVLRSQVHATPARMVVRRVSCASCGVCVCESGGTNSRFLGRGMDTVVGKVQSAGLPPRSSCPSAMVVNLALAHQSSALAKHDSYRLTAADNPRSRSQATAQGLPFTYPRNLLSLILKPLCSDTCAADITYSVS